jgi:hypothetical protein
LLDDFNAIESAGNTAAEFVLSQLESIETHPQIPLWSRIERFEFNRKKMGYLDGVWPYEHGAVYCGISIQDAVCWGEGEPPEAEMLSSGCIPFPAELPAPKVTSVGAARIGDLHLLSLPGEPGTELSLNMVSRIQKNTGIKALGVIGYALDYIGYSLMEDDWYLGGYESSGAIWGPKQGAWLGQHAVGLFDHAVGGEALAWDPPPPRATYVIGDSSYQAETPLGDPKIVTEPATEVVAGDLVVVTIHGGDPWHGLPTIGLERLSGTDALGNGRFDAVVRKNGAPMRNIDGYEFETRLATSPGYADNLGPIQRDFEWTFVFSTRRPAATTSPDLAGGTFRFSITGSAGTNAGYALNSQPFKVLDSN